MISICLSRFRPGLNLITLMLFPVVVVVLSISQALSAPFSNTISPDSNIIRNPDNPVILQAFYWYIGDHGSAHEEPESNLWDYIAREKASDFGQHGFTHVWLPPTGKAFGVVGEGFNVGYAVYDHYDLGEFHQLSRVRTKYGTKQQLHRAVDALHANGIKVIADIVMNHMMGTDNAERVFFSKSFVYDENSHTTTFLGSGHVIAHLNFDFDNENDPYPRRTKYSDFQWRKEHFDGMEYYDRYYLFENKRPDKVNYFGDLTLPSNESELYKFLRSDIILGADLDFQHPEVQQEMTRWTKWLIDEVGFDGLRVDAIRHIDTPFIHNWANNISSYMQHRKKDFLIFGEAWDGWAERLDSYLKGHPHNNDQFYNVGQGPSNYCGINNSMSLFDVPLHYDFQKVAKENHSYPETRISDLPNRGLLSKSPHKTITFVDNHDTTPTQELASYIPLHTKLQAYTFILLNEFGIPTVFYRDFYKGNFVSNYRNNNLMTLHNGIKNLIRVRHENAYGSGQYFTNPGKKGILGYRRYGVHNRPGSGLIYLIREYDSHDNGLWIQADGHEWELAAGNGHISNGRFYLPSGSNWAVWIPKRN